MGLVRIGVVRDNVAVRIRLRRRLHKPDRPQLHTSLLHRRDRYRRGRRRQPENGIQELLAGIVGIRHRHRSLPRRADTDARRPGRRHLGQRSRTRGDIPHRIRPRLSRLHRRRALRQDRSLPDIHRSLLGRRGDRRRARRILGVGRVSLVGRHRLPQRGLRQDYFRSFGRREPPRRRRGETARRHGALLPLQYAQFIPVRRRILLPQEPDVGIQQPHVHKSRRDEGVQRRRAPGRDIHLMAARGAGSVRRDSQLFRDHRSQQALFGIRLRLHRVVRRY